VDSHDEMHPEFAREPVITVPCTKEAVLLWSDGGPDWGDPMVVCSDHGLEMMTYAAKHEEAFQMRLLGEKDRREFRAGAAYAVHTDITEQTAMMAYHEDWLAAGFGTPDNSSVLFDCGWEWTMIKRINAIVHDSEVRMELEEQAQYERWGWQQEAGE
jgi:hypothetical protein